MTHLLVWHFQRTNSIEVILEKKKIQTNTQTGTLKSDRHGSSRNVSEFCWSSSPGDWVVVCTKARLSFWSCPCYSLSTVKPCPFLSGPSVASGYQHNKKWLEHLTGGQLHTEVRILPPAYVLIYIFKNEWLEYIYVLYSLGGWHIAKKFSIKHWHK